MYRTILSILFLLSATGHAAADSRGPWFDTVASKSRDVASRVVALADESVVTFGRFSTHLHAAEPGHRLFNRGHYDLFLLRHDRDGKRAWIRSVGGAGNETAGDLVVDQAGRICVSGSFEGRAGGIRDGLPELRSHGMSDGFVSCYESDGTPRWTRRIGGKGADSVNALAPDSDGGLVAGVDFMQVAGVPMAAEQGTLVSAMGERSAALVRLNGEGHAVSRRVFEASRSVSIRDVVALESGSVMALLRFDGQLQLRQRGGLYRVLDSGDRSDLLLLRLGADDEVEFARRIGGPGAEDGAELAVNERGEVAVIGSFVDEIHTTANQVSSAGSSDAFLAVFDGSGAPLALHAFGAEAAEVGFSVVADGAHWVFALSFIERTRIGGELVRGRGTSAALVTMAPSGLPRVGLRVDGAGLEQIVTIARLGHRTFAIAGNFNGDLQFGETASGIQPLAKLDAFVGTVELDAAAVAGPARGRQAVVRRSSRVPHRW